MLCEAPKCLGSSRMEKVITNFTGFEEYFPWCSISLEQFRDFIEKKGWNEFIDVLTVHVILLGPVLWSISIIGMILNVFVVMIGLATINSPSSLFFGSISFFHALKCATMLLKLDMEIGKLILFKNIVSVKQDCHLLLLFLI